VKLLSCHTALEEQVRGLIAHRNLTQNRRVVKEMLAHTLPDVLVVASMVARLRCCRQMVITATSRYEDGSEGNAMPKVGRSAVFGSCDSQFDSTYVNPQRLG